MSYAKALSDYLRTKEELNKREASGYWNPSQMGFCDRRNILKHDGLPQNPFDDRTLRVFWLGSAIHEALQGTFPFEVVGHEVKVKDEEYKLSGRVDTLAIVDGVLEVVEFKSIQSKKFSYGKLPDPHHVMQIGCYLTFPTYTEEEDGTKKYNAIPSRGRIVYWSKDDARIEEFLVAPTEKLQGEVRAELKRLEGLYQRYKSTGELPAPTQEAWQPRYCDYRGTGKCCGDPVPEPQNQQQLLLGTSESPEDGKV